MTLFPLIVATVGLAVPPTTTRNASESIYQVRYEYRLRNRTSTTLQGVRIWIPIPHSEANQEIRRLEWTSPGQPYEAEHVSDQYGQEILQFTLPKLEPNAAIETGFLCVFAPRPVKVALDPKKAGVLKDIPADILSAYRKNVMGVYDLDSPEIQRTAARLAQPNTNLLDQVMAIHDFVAGMRYRRDGVWDSAAVVLRRMTGSCSEFSFVFGALCRSAGIPTRFAGGSTCRPEGPAPWPRIDAIYHRWTEVYIPPYGWVPFDVTRDRGVPPKRLHAGSPPQVALILSRGGGGSRLLGNQYIGWNTHGPLLERSRRFVWSLTGR